MYRVQVCNVVLSNSNEKTLVCIYKKKSEVRNLKKCNSVKCDRPRLLTIMLKDSLDIYKLKAKQILTTSC